MNSLNIILIFILIYWLFIKYLDSHGILKKYNISAYGPVLMIRTHKGQKLLDKLAVPKRFWRLFADIGLPLMLIGMLLMFFMILLIDYYLISSFQTQTVPTPNKYNEIQNIFLIPGINDFIPLKEGIIALIITLVVHEFSHAILCKVEGIKVKSMGILMAIVPIGGFAEPDEEQLFGKKNKDDAQENTQEKIATRKQRIRILTSGVMANFVTALIGFILFFYLLGFISPVGEVMITEVLPGSPAEKVGLKPDMVVTKIDNLEISTPHDFLIYAEKLKPKTEVTVYINDKGKYKEFSFLTSENNKTSSGVKIADVVKDTPAEKSGLKPNMTITKINNTDIKDLGDFILFMNSTHPGQKIDIYVYANNSEKQLVFKNITLSKYPYNKDVKKGFLGISYSNKGGALSYSLGIGIGQFPANDYLNMLKSIPSLLTESKGWVMLFSLPMYGLSGEGFPGFSGLIKNFYEPTGWVSVFGNGIFIIVNILLWIGWMNFYVGLFNCLPAVPLDGGHVFRDVVSSILSKFMKDGNKVEVLANTIVLSFALLVLFSFIFVIIAPYIAHGW